MSVTGRPSGYSEAIGDEICERIANGESLRKICLGEHMPSQAAVFRWLGDDRYVIFREQYARARLAQADLIFDEIIDIADDGSNDWMERHDDQGGNIGWKENGESINRSKIRIDARKWMAGKLRPKVYGEKVLMGSDPENPLPSGVAIHFKGKAGDA